MPRRDLSGRFAIVGVGDTAVGRVPEQTKTGLALLAAARAIRDSGLDPSEVDGVLTSQMGPTFIFSLEIATRLGIRPHYTTVMELGGATSVCMAQQAAMAIDAGMCRAVVCVHAQKQQTEGSRQRHGGALLRGFDEFDRPFGHPGAIAVHAMAARRHMHEYGSRTEDFARVAVAMRRHASLNANAQRREPITVEDHQASPWVVEPFRLLDCCQVSDGAGAFVVTSAERARDLPQPPAYLSGFSQFHPHRFLSERAADLTSTGAGVSGPAAFEMAGLTPADVDVAELYDCFTYVVLTELEDYGFCKKGEGPDFVADANIEIGGSLPVNTHGGLLSQGHVEGMLHVVEAVRQLRGGQVEPERQVPGAAVALVSGHGGQMSTHGTLILSTAGR